MKPILTKKIIEDYIKTTFGESDDLITEKDMLKLINKDNLTLEKVYYWSLIDNSLKIENNIKTTILHSASKRGQNNIINFAIDKNNNIDKTDYKNITPLMIASINQHKDSVSLLLQNGANINHQDKDGWSVLHYACNWNDIDMVKFLIQKEIDIYLKGAWKGKLETALDVAIRHKYYEIVDYLTPLYNNN